MWPLLWHRKNQCIVVEKPLYHKQLCAKTTPTPFSQTPFFAERNIWRLQKSSFFGIQRSLTLRGAPTSGFGLNAFFSLCLEIIESGSSGVYLSRLRSSQMVVTLSSTISLDTQFAWNTLGMPSQTSQQNTFSVLKSCSYFHVSHNSSPPASSSAALSCSTFSFPVLFASVLHVWVRVSVLVHKGKLIPSFVPIPKPHHSVRLGLSLG